VSFSLQLSDCLSALDANLSGDDVVVRGVSIDTRTLKPGDLFVAIKGHNHDGHDYIETAVKAGAKAVLVHSRIATSVPQMRVVDTTRALGCLARYWARRHQVPTIAVTGSNGKTTVKEIIASILRQLGPVLATRGNLNNDIGVPLTLLGLRPEHQYAVIEMGASQAGDIERLVTIAEPDVAVITNIGAAHIEGFGSIERIAEAKSEIYAGLSKDGWAVVNNDDVYADVLRDHASHCHVRSFGLTEDADVQGVPGNGLVIQTTGKRLKPRFPLAGDHNGINALAAVAAVQCLDVQPASIVRGLESVRPVAGRLEKKAGIHGASIIDDSYNANPVSAKAAIDVLAKQSGVRYLVLGDMAELGEDAANLHRELGLYAREAKLDGVWTVGKLASYTDMGFGLCNTPRMAQPYAQAVGDQVGHGASVPSLAGGEVPEVRKGRTVTKGALRVSEGGHFKDQESLIQALRPWLAGDTTVLVKGSRSARMERVVKGLVPTTQALGTSARINEALS